MGCVFGWPIYSDESAEYAPEILAGVGSWRSTLPAENVQDRDLGLVARSTDATEASTQMEFDLKRTCPLIIFAAIFPNLSSAGTVRFKASAIAGNYGSPIYDSGALTPWPAGETLDTLGEIRPTGIAVAGAVQNARFVHMQISDTANPDGFVDASRAVIAGGIRPTRTMRWGAWFGVETATQRFGKGSRFIYNEEPQRRYHEFDLKYMSDDEARRELFDMQRLAGIAGQFWWVPDADSSLLWLESYLATLERLNPLQHQLPNRNAMAFRVQEEL
jgi:hypothetical protein